MKLQADTRTTLILLALVLGAQIATAAPQNGRPRKGRGVSDANQMKLAKAQKEKCYLEKNGQHYFQVRMNVTTPEHTNANRAINPWTYRIDTDHQRFPSSIAQVVCAGHCSVFNLETIEIKHQVLVLKKEHSGCMFTMETMPVTIGCTCVEADVMKDS